MDTVTIFKMTFKISRVAFHLNIFGGWSVYWYGIIIAFGVFSALYYGMKNGDRLGMNPDHIFNSFIVVLPVSILAARSYYIIFDPSGGSSFKNFFDFSGGHGFSGLAIYGGVIGAVAAIFIMQRIYKFSLLAALDITSIGFLLGQGIGRWGNFFNQEAYGTATGSTWFGMTGNLIQLETGSDALVHPCFLYESIWCIAGFFLLNHLSKKRKYKGQIALYYGVWYGFERTFIELLRTDSLMIGSLRVSSLLSAVLCVSCLVLIIVFNKKFKAENSEDYVPQFANESEKADFAEPYESSCAVEEKCEENENISDKNGTDANEFDKNKSDKNESDISE